MQVGTCPVLVKTQLQKRSRRRSSLYYEGRELSPPRYSDYSRVSVDDLALDQMCPDCRYKEARKALRSCVDIIQHHKTSGQVPCPARSYNRRSGRSRPSYVNPRLDPESRPSKRSSKRSFRSLSHPSRPRVDPRKAYLVQATRRSSSVDPRHLLCSGASRRGLEQIHVSRLSKIT